MPKPAKTAKPAQAAQAGDAPDPSAEPADNDAEFILRTFGVNPAKYTPEGKLDRELLAADVEGYRTLFANRVLMGRHA